ncbi:restriction endonuclease subunit S [uncultured Bifidobacterium sp.]|uniref:restriction endonuclease subunit S n=1 Tax=uncultured Bifidobacterium sp. TaxID=165187 RepID=UPI00259203E8|nr:restriction endonuclease subunit S [uncultured Bifidobacterium sp.]
MSAKNLRDSILQMAVEGKLVEQRKEEGTAEDLLASIREQRAQLVREKKAKPVKGGESVIWRDEDGHWVERRGKGEAVCIDEEIPFDIPDSWCWARMNALGDIVGGGTPKTNISEYWTVSDKGIPWITPADMRMMPSINIDGGARYISEEGLVHSSAQLMPAGSVIMSSRAPIGYLGIASRPLSTNQGFKSVVPAKEGMSRWLVVSLEALMPSIQKRASGTTFKEISGYEFGKTIVPIPPFVEQGRIVAKIDELMPLVDEYGKAQERRERLDRELPVKLRKSILQAAVEGKLTERSDDDEPASVLLASIREKRAQLVREGKAKSVKGGESIIYRDDAGHWFERRGKSAPSASTKKSPSTSPIPGAGRG